MEFPPHRHSVLRHADVSVEPLIVAREHGVVCVLAANLSRRQLLVALCLQQSGGLTEDDFPYETG